MATAIDFGKKSLIIITGASQGIGQTISEIVGSKVKENSKIVLIARSESGLIQTRNKIIEVYHNVHVEIFPYDLSKPDIKDFEAMFDKILKEMKSYENAVIFHNAGQVGSITYAAELNDLHAWRSYYDLNLFSTVVLNSTFIAKCKQYIENLYIINISSLCGHKPFTNLALYGSAKAARDLYFSVLAIEEPNIVVLRYCPGPVNTAMFNEILENAQDANLRSQFKEIKDNNHILTSERTVYRLFGLLESGNFSSGDLIDYFDK